MKHRGRVLALLGGATLAAVLGARAPRADVPEGGYRVLALPGTPEAPLSSVHALNASGVAAGWVEDGKGMAQAALWDPSARGRILLKPLSANGRRTLAYDLNDGGAAVGSSTAGQASHAVLWAGRSALPEDLGTLGGPGSLAYGLNENLETVGESSTLEGGLSPFYRPAGGP